jgi:hypothetical protein
MRMPGCAALSLFLLSFGAGVAAGQDQKNDLSAATAITPSEVRRHLKVISSSGIDDYIATEISTYSEKLDRTRTIVQNAQGERFLLTYESDYEKQTTSHEIREVGGREFLRMKFSSLWTAITRSGTIEEAKKHPELLKRTDLRFEFTTAGNGVLAGDNLGLWDDLETQREWRARLRTMVTPQFLEELEIMWANGFLASAVGDRFAAPVRYVVYRPDCPAPELRVEAVPPDCDFDKKFGFECSDKQKARAEKALAAKPPSTKYY